MYILLLVFIYYYYYFSIASLFITLPIKYLVVLKELFQKQKLIVVHDQQ